MPEDDLELVPDAFCATLIAGIIRATAPRAIKESEAQASQRAAAIVDMFKNFAPDSTLEAMTASHCVTLHFQLHDAMMMVPDVAGGEKTERQLWARIRFLSGALRGWIRELKALQKQRVAEDHVPAAAEARPHRASERTPPGPVQPRPPRQDSPDRNEAPASAETASRGPFPRGGVTA